MKPRGIAILLLCGALTGTEAAGDPRAELRVTPGEATVGDPLEAVLTLELPPGASFAPAPLADRMGPFSVAPEGWSGPESLEDGGLRWTWRGRLSTFRTGEARLPAITLRFRVGETPREVRTAPVDVTIVSVLDDSVEGVDPELLADLKGPASVAPDFQPLRLALALFGALLALALLLWWLQRRYASRLARVPVEEDPFRREAPHVWVYKELQRLLERRLAEQGRVDLFYAELSRILKLYLGGRYRVDLLEHTTDELPELLRQAGAADAATGSARALLAECDRVKFARERPGEPSWRAAVEAVYRIVDSTRPGEQAGAEAGAA